MICDDESILIWGDDVTGESDVSAMTVFEYVLHAIPQEETDVGVDLVGQEFVEWHDENRRHDKQHVGHHTDQEVPCKVERDSDHWVDLLSHLRKRLVQILSPKSLRRFTCHCWRFRSFLWYALFRWTSVTGLVIQVLLLLMGERC